MLREYEDIHPGVAEQLFNLHEKQANHRMEMERQTRLPTVKHRRGASGRLSYLSWLR